MTVAYVPTQGSSGALLKKFDVGISPMAAGVVDYPDDVKGSDNVGYAKDAFTTWITPSNVATPSPSAQAQSAVTNPNTGNTEQVSPLWKALDATGIPNFLKEALILLMVLILGLVLVGFGLRSLTK